MKTITNTRLQNVANYNNNQPVRKTNTAGKTAGNLGTHKLDSNLAKAGKNKAVCTPHDQSKVLTGIRQNKGLQVLRGGSNRGKSSLGENPADTLQDGLKAVKRVRKGTGKPATVQNKAGGRVKVPMPQSLKTYFGGPFHANICKFVHEKDQARLRKSLESDKEFCEFVMARASMGANRTFPNGTRSVLRDGSKGFVDNLAKCFKSVTPKGKSDCMREMVKNGIEVGNLDVLNRLPEDKSWEGCKGSILRGFLSKDGVSKLFADQKVFNNMPVDGWYPMPSKEGAQVKKVTYTKVGEDSYNVKYDVKVPVKGFASKIKGRGCMINMKDAELNTSFTLKVDFRHKKGNENEGRQVRTTLQDIGRMDLSCGSYKNHQIVAKKA